MSKYFSNIRLSSVLNPNEVPCDSLLCCVCLEIAMNPNECQNCNILICAVCSDLLSMIGKSCIRERCQNSIQKANKFIRGILSLLKINCSYCDKPNINYDDYQAHLKDCLIYNECSHIKMLSKLKDLSAEVEIKRESLNKIVSIKPNINQSSIAEVKNTLKPEQKMELYNATIEGSLEKVKKMILEKGYPILEEVSQVGYRWTSLHYCFHYGKKLIIDFYMDYLYKKGELHSSLKMTSSDGRCPLLCLLKSNCVTPNEKQAIIKELISKYSLVFSDQVKQELTKRNIKID